MTQSLHVAVFDDEKKFLETAHACAEHEFEIVDAYTPYPMHEVEHVMGLRRTRLPWVTLVGGLVGLALGLWFQYWASATDWPLDVGGKPWDSLPAFVPVGFEMTVLLAGLGTVFGLLIRSGLGPGKRPRRPIERVTDDRFALVLRWKSGARRCSPAADLFDEKGAVEHWEEQS